MKKIIKLITMVTALNMVALNSVLLMFASNYVYLNKHDVNASLLKWNLSAADAQIVKKYEYQLHEVASQESINEFNNLYDNNKNQAIWSNYDDLQRDLTHTKIGGKNIDVNWIAMYKNAGLTNQQLQLAEQQQLRFYNIFAKVFAKSNVIKLIQKVAPVAVNENVVAWTAFSPESDNQRMGYGPDFANIDLIDEQYQAGFWSSDQIISVTTHEYGHALSNLIGLSVNERKTFNTNWKWSDNDKSDAITTSVPQVSHQAIIDNNHKQINDRALCLMNYLADQAKISNDKLKLLFGLVTVSSNYGRSAWNGNYNEKLEDEFFAESFARWILTPQNQRDWGWELENNFFLHYLPTVL